MSVEGLVPVRHITKTFASGKTEKIVYQALADVGLPSGKGDLISIESFTFDKFYKIYQTICPRSSIVNKTKETSTLLLLTILMNYFFTDFTSFHF